MTPQVIDVHAHYIPRDAVDLMKGGRVGVSLHEDDGVSGCIGINGMRVGATIDALSDVEAMMRAMDDAEVDMRVISPPPFTYRYWDDPEQCLSLHRRLNDATAEVVRRYPDRFTGLATVPLQAPEAAISELARAGRTRSGRSDGGHGGGRRQSQRRRSLTGAVRPLGPATPASGAPGLRAQPTRLPALPRQPARDAARVIDRSGQSAAVWSVGRTCRAARVLRARRRHPAVPVGTPRQGVGRTPETRAATAAPPSAGLERVWFDSLTHSPPALRYLIDLVGTDHVVIGSDSPFDVEEAQPLRRLRECPGLTAREEEAIAHASALDWLEGVVASPAQPGEVDA